MPNIEKIVLQFEHQIFTIENDCAKEILDYIEKHCDIYSNCEWDIVDRKPFKEKI